MARLRASALTSVVIRPTAFFSDMSEVLSLARKGRVFVFGSGAASTPYCVDSPNSRSAVPAPMAQSRATERRRSLPPVFLPPPWPIEFFLAVATQGMVAPLYGKDQLADFFRSPGCC